MPSILDVPNSDRRSSASGNHSAITLLGPRGTVGRKMLLVLWKFLAPVALVVAWFIVTDLHLVRPIFLPSPGDIGGALLNLGPQLPGALKASVAMTLTGFCVGSGVGVGLGLAMAYSKLIRDLFGNLLDFIRPVPVFALIPLFVLWFGIGRMPQIILIALGTSVVLGVTTVEAVKNVAPVHIKASLTLGASRWQIYQSIIVPSIGPNLLGAIRVAAAASWGLDVAAEFIGAQSGLGHLMINRQQYLDTAGIMLIVIIYSILAVLFDLIITNAQRPLTRWTERGTRVGAVASVIGNA